LSHRAPVFTNEPAAPGAGRRTNPLAGLVRTPHDVAATIVRLGLGIVFFPHGAQKMLGWFGGHGFAATVQALTSGLHIPTVFAVLAICAEFFGSIGLILGLFGRIAAFGIACVMTVAVLAAGHLQHGFFMNWTGQQGGEGFEFHLLALAIAIAVMVRGSGALSLDRMMSRGRGGAGVDPAA
jgi:putative oxidoreductase